MAVKSHNTPVIVNGSVAKQVTNILTERIIANEYKIGDFLPTEEEFCSEFNIGRSSVREAIKTLESYGLVRKLQGKGVMVVDESIDAMSQMLQIAIDYRSTSLRDLMDFRVAMEVKIAELAAIRASKSDLDKMQKYLDLMRNEEYTPSRFVAYDYGFHEAVAEASGNNVAILMIKTLRPMLTNQIAKTLDPKKNPEKVLHYHKAIFEAISNKDIKKAAAAMEEHLNATQSIIEKLIPDFAESR